MQNIRRATKKHRKVLLGVVILLMLGLVGSFATWNSGGRASSGGEESSMTLEQQIAFYESYIGDLLKDSKSEPDHTDSMTLARSYLDLSYLYSSKASADVSAAQTAADTAAAEAEEKGEEYEYPDTSAAGVAAQGSSMIAAQQAQIYYQRALDIAPDTLNEIGRAEIKAGLANARQAQDDLEGALAFMTEAYELNPANTQYVVAQASLLEALDRPEEALALYEQASEMYPENTQLLVAQAALQAQLGQEAEARALYVKARELAPGDLNVAYNYATFIFSYETPEAGVAELQAFRDALPEGDPAIPEADNAIINLQGWADMFASFNSGGEGTEGEAAEGEAANGEEAAE